jgi:hypothetical protein
MVEDMIVWFGCDYYRFSKVLYLYFQVLYCVAMEVVSDSVFSCIEGCLVEIRLHYISLHCGFLSCRCGNIQIFFVSTFPCIMSVQVFHKVC